MSSLRLRLGVPMLALLSTLAAGSVSATQLLRVTPADKAQYLKLLQVAPEAGDEGAVVRGAAVEFPADEGRAAQLTSLGFTVEVAVADLEGFYASRLGHLRDYGGYHTYTTAIQAMDALAAAHPTIMSQKFSIGTTIEGRSLWVYKISSSPNSDNGNPEIFFNGYIHAREPIGCEVVLDLATTLANGYGSDSRITNIVNTRQIYIEPVVNPDGVQYNATTNPNGGGMWRKNRRHNSDGSYGVDLNRNFGYMWGYDNEGSSPYGGDETYRGTSAFSEAETAGMRDFVNAHDFTIAVNNHSFGGHELFPWGYDDLHPLDYDTFLALGRMHRATSGYNVATAWEILYQTNGDANDWMYGEQGTKPKIFGFIPEIGNDSDGFWPAQARIPALVAENHEPNLHFCELADDPYRILQPGWPQVNSPDSVSTTFTLNWTVPNPDPDNPARVWNLIEATGATVGADNLEGANQSRWTADGWTWSTARSHSATHSFWSGNLDGQNDVLISRRGHRVQAGEQLRFWTWYQLENAYDYGYVEVSTNGRNFTPLAGSITTNSDPNNRNFGNGITGSSGGWVQATFNLALYTNQVIWVRFRYNSDAYTAYEGWYVDDIEPSDLFATETVVGNGLLNAQHTFTNHPLGTFDYLAQAVDGEGDQSVWGPPRQVTVANLAGVAENTRAPWRGLELDGTNPFRASAGLHFAVPSDSHPGEPLRLTVHDLSGREVATLLVSSVGEGARPGSELRERWSPEGLPAGLYFARLTIGGKASEQRLVYMK
jgi:hypothetical protein